MRGVHILGLIPLIWTILAVSFMNVAENPQFWPITFCTDMISHESCRPHLFSIFSHVQYCKRRPVGDQDIYVARNESKLLGQFLFSIHSKCFAMRVHAFEGFCPGRSVNLESFEFGAGVAEIFKSIIITNYSMFLD